MKLINHMGYSIHIVDIGVNIPSSKFGVYNIPNELMARSGQLGSLIKSGRISVVADRSDSFREFKIGEETMYILPGTTIWEGKGKTFPVLKGDFSDKLSFEEFNGIRKNYTQTLPKKYVITRNCDMNISLERISCILTKQNPSFEITEEYFNSKEIQSGISCGRIIVSKILSAKIDSNGDLQYVESHNEVSENKEPDVVVEKGVDRSSEYNDVHCMWEGPIMDTGGYANMNRQYVINLDKLGASVRPVIILSDSHIEQSLRDKINTLAQTNVRPKCPKVYATNVPGKHNGRVVSYTMMETELFIHRKLAAQINTANEVWVPSEWNKETFSKSAIKRDIFVMPLGVDTELYRPRNQSVFFSFPVKNYVFYAVSTWIWRKGWDVLLKAYSKAFTSDDDVSLVIFTHVPAQSPERYVYHIANHIKCMFSGKDISRFPNLSIVTSILPASIVPLIYNSVDCFTLFSRGEGWGLPYCEASASGLPVVGADHGGQKMFLNNENSLLVEPDLVSSCHPSLLYMTPYYEGMKFANYSDKSINEAAEKLRYAYEHQDEMKRKAEICRSNLLRNFTWDKCARRVADRLREIQ